MIIPTQTKGLKMKTYAIIDNQGNVYAHDIINHEDARAKLDDYNKELGDNDLELEIVHA